MRRRPNEIYGLSGDYRCWDEAERGSSGYDTRIILEKTTAALLKIKAGEAAYERDSVLFDEIQYAWPLLAGLLWVASQSGGKLDVLDFGGSLGSTYFQNRIFLSGLTELRWNVVEQPGHVRVGRERFEDDHLKFYEHVEECLAATDPNVVILSSVLQYLEHPYDTLMKLLTVPSDHVIVDRTPFWDGPADRLCMQHVPPSIYPASYPSWVFSADRFRSCLRDGWQIVAEFDSLDTLKGPVDLVYKGMILSRLNGSTYKRS